MLYQVKKRYGRGSETACAEFNDVSDAKLFIDARLTVDAGLKIKVTYLLYEGVDPLEEYLPLGESRPGSTTQMGSTTTQRGAAGAEGRTSSFQPTPFNTVPRPPGTPQKWIKDSDEEEEK